MILIYFLSFFNFAADLPAPQAPPPPPAVTIEPKKEIERYRVVLEPQHRTILSAQLSGIPVIKITKKIGDSFKEDELLIQFDPAIFEGNLKKAESDLIKNETKFEGKKLLFEEKSASLFELKEAESNHAESQANLILAQKNLKASSITAPYDGKVVRIMIEEHEIPHENTKDVIEVIDDTKLIAKLFIPSKQLIGLKVGTPIYIKLDDTGDTITAHISRIGAAIEPSSSTILIEAEIDNLEGNLKAGMSGMASFKESP